MKTIQLTDGFGGKVSVPVSPEYHEREAARLRINAETAARVAAEKAADEARKAEFAPKPRTATPRKPFRLWNLPMPSILPYAESAPAEPPIQPVELAKAFRAAASLLVTPCYAAQGATVTTYELKLSVHNFQKNLKAVEEAIEAVEVFAGLSITRTPPSKGHFAVQIPNKNRETVCFKSAFGASVVETFGKDNKGKLMAVLGRDSYGEALYVDLTTLPHLMAVGQSGGGKSIAVGTIINSLLLRYTPNCLKIVLIDPKQVEYAKYEGIPHLEMPVAYTPESAMKTLDNVLKIMESRYTEMKALGVRTYPAHKPKIVVFVDEFASLMVRNKTKFENKIARIAAEARAAGIVCVISTQTPNGEIMTKMMRVNFPCRLVFRCQTSTDSRIATGMSGDEAPKANKLIGRGDGFFIHENAVRFQAAYSPDLVTEPIVGHWKNQ